MDFFESHKILKIEAYLGIDDNKIPAYVFEISPMINFNTIIQHKSFIYNNSYIKNNNKTK